VMRCAEKGIGVIKTSFVLVVEPAANAVGQFCVLSQL